MRGALRFEFGGRSSGIAIGSFADRLANASGSEISSRIIAELLLQGSAAGASASRDSAESAARSLVEALRSGESNSFVHAFSNLSDSQQEDLRHRFGACLDRLFILSRERNPKILYLSLHDLALGDELRRNGDNSLAGAILKTLAESTELPVAVPEALRSEARVEYDAMREVGSVWGRLEFVGKGIVHGVSNPGWLIPMGVAGKLCSAVRLGVLGRMAAGPASWYSRGFVAGALASSVAFPAEVLFFWGTQRAYLQFTQSELHHQPDAVHELGSLALTFSLLKLSGAAAGGLFDRVHGINALTGEIARLPQWTRLSRSFLQQAGMLSGIAAGDYAETRLGWRPPPSSQGAFWTNSLITLLQFNAGGQVFGSKHSARMVEMALRTQNWKGPSRLQPKVFGLFPRMSPEVAAGRGTRVFSLGREGPSREHILEISSSNSDRRGGDSKTESPLRWEELRGQLVKLGKRGYLRQETVHELLSNWLAPAKNRGTSPIQATREDTVAGMIDFICKETHTEEIRGQISGFIGEAVQRRDEGMMGNLAAYFQQYHLGVMRETEVYDRFLKAVLTTGRFYLTHPGLRGPVLELFEKLELGNRDNRALQAATILQRSDELLAQGFDEVTLLRRGTHGQAILLARHPHLQTRTIAVTSIARPLASRENLETYLNHAERGLLQNGELLRTGDPSPNGEGIRILSIQISRFGSETIRQDVAVWARDYLEEHSELSEIHLVIPEEGNNADPSRSEFFQTVPVTRRMPTTGKLIRNLEFSIKKDPEHAASRLELHRLRDQWARHLFSREPDLKADVAGSPRRLKFFPEFIDKALGVKVDPTLLSRVVDLRGVGFDIRDLDCTYGDRGLRLQAAVIPRENILRQAEQERSLLPPKLQKEHGTNRGSLSFYLSRNKDSGDLQVHFDAFSLPPHLRGYGAGPKFFSELVHLSRELGATSIVADAISGDHRLAFARYGVQYKTLDEFHRKGMLAFHGFLLGHQKEYPEFRNYDIKAVSQIRSPRDIANAHFDPITKSLQLTPWISGDPTGQVPKKLPEEYRIGRLFLLNPVSSFDGFFGLEDDGYSMRTFRAYLRRRF